MSFAGSAKTGSWLSHEVQPEFTLSEIAETFERWLEALVLPENWIIGFRISLQHRRIAICISLLSQYKTEPFLILVVTRDEKWYTVYIVYNVKRLVCRSFESPTTTSKSESYPKKVWLNLWYTDCIGNNSLRDSTNITKSLNPLSTIFT